MKAKKLNEEYSVAFDKDKESIILFKESTNQYVEIELNTLFDKKYPFIFKGKEREE